MRKLQLAAASLVALGWTLSETGYSQLGGGGAGPAPAPKPAPTPPPSSGGGGGGYPGCPPGGYGGGVPPSYGGSPSAPGPAGPSAPGPAGPMTPGPGGPAIPGRPGSPGPAAPGAPGATTYTGPPSPFPPPGHPFSPFTPGGAGGDPLSWQIWWALHEDGLLDLRQEIASISPESGSTDFAIGAGQVLTEERSLRPSVEVLNAAVMPTVFLAVLAGGPVDLVCSEAIAVGRIGDPRTDTMDQPPGPTLRNLLSNPVLDVRQCAALGLGILGLEEHLDELRALLENGEAGADLVGRDEVDDETRAFAAFALGQLARETELDFIREEIAQLLIDTIELETDSDAEAPTPDVAVAATLALGQIHLPLGPPCECHGAEHEPTSSRQAMIHHLFRLFNPENDNPKLVRAHAATGMARMVEGCPQALRDGVQNQLLEVLAVRSREPHEVQASAVAALGLIGDADDDELDRRTRDVLMRVARHGDPIARRFALVSMGQVAGRPGEGEGEPFAGTAVVRTVLLKSLGGGKAGLKTWSALALGIMGKSLRENGGELSEDVDRALRAKLARAKTTEELGALAMASGLRRDGEAGSVHAGKLPRLRETGAMSFTALAIGLVGERDSLADLHELLAEHPSDAHLTRRTAAALALLGDRGIAGSLALRLDDEELAEGEVEAVACALGVVGDGSVVASLGSVLNDPGQTALARTYAVHALGAISDEDATPWYVDFVRGLNYAAATETLANAHGTGVLNRR